MLDSYSRRKRKNNEIIETEDPTMKRIGNVNERW